LADPSNAQARCRYTQFEVGRKKKGEIDNMLDPKLKSETAGEAPFLHSVKIPLTDKEMLIYTDELTALDTKEKEITLAFESQKTAYKSEQGEIRERIGGGSEAGISARLRDFRKIKFGGHKVYRRRRGEASKGLHEYRLELKADMEIAA